MRKIRGFRLNLRPKEIQRRAKKAKLDLAPLGMASEVDLTELIEEFSKSTKASVLYDSFPPEEGSALAPMTGLAFSLCVCTLGQELDSYIDAMVQRTPERAPLLAIIAETALDDARRFVLALVEDEAKTENCDLSPLQEITAPEPLAQSLSRLEGHKINVSVSDQGLAPRHTTVFGLSWMTRAKKRRKQ